MASKTDRVVNQFKSKPQPLTPIMTAGDEGIFLPNHSGDHSKGKVYTTPVNDYDIANKKYVDDNIGGGSGDVVGPASATDNAICRFNLTTGKLIQDSGVSITDTNQLISTQSAFKVAAQQTFTSHVNVTAFNEDNTAVDMLRATSADAVNPTFALHGAVTIGANSSTAVTGTQKYIYRADGTDVAVADGGTGVSLLGGATGSRPSSPAIGNTYYDSTLGKLIVYSGSAWVNVDGSAL